eukprot:g6706.t1
MQLSRVSQRSGRHYRVPGTNNLFPSVTTVLNVLNKPALVPWSTRVTLDAVKRDILSQPQLSAPEQWLGGVLSRAKTEHKTVLSKAADFGTRAHQAIDDMIEGVPISVEVDGGVRTVLAGFEEWRSAANMRLAGDQMVYSRRYGFAGAMDALGLAEADGSVAVIDFKTSNGIYDSHLLQVAAYAKAYEEMTGRVVSEAYVVRFDKARPAFECQRVVDIDVAFNAFKAALYLFRALNADDAQALAEPAAL